MAHSGKGRHDKAVEEFSKVIEANPNSPVLYKDRATAYMKLGDYDAAKKDLDKALEQDKNLAAAYAAMGLLLVQAPGPPLRDPAKALQFAERAVKLTGGTGPDMLQILAEVQYSLKRPADAIATLRSAISLDPDNKEYHQLMAKWNGSYSPSQPSRDEQPKRVFETLW
jgi:tetratricopeptide (TPR) repeat protein